MLFFPGIHFRIKIELCVHCPFVVRLFFWWNAKTWGFLVSASARLKKCTHFIFWLRLNQWIPEVSQFLWLWLSQSIYMYFLTRIHSTRMRTAHSLTVSRSIRVSDRGGVCQTPWMQTPLDADLPWMQTHPLWTEWLTDGCKYITFANFVCGR